MAYDIEQVKKSITQSTILSAVEKAEWLQLLPDMSDQQVAELVRIIGAPVSATAPAAPVPPAPRAPEPKVDIKQKEIGTSVPFYEPEIPAHLTPKPEVPKSVPTPPKAPTPPDPAELQKRVASIVEDLENRRQGKHIPTSETPKAAPQSAASPAASPAAAPAGNIEPLALKTPDDFAKIRAAHLHGDNFGEELKKIYDSMVIIGKKSSIYDVVTKFEQSPLYKTYIETGIGLLNDPNPDREVAYGNVIKAMQAKGAEVLSKQEFESFADFRKSLEQIL